MAVKRLSILGVGLLGGSVGLAAKSSLSHCKIMGYGHRHVTVKRALEVGAIDESADTVAEAVRGADLVVLCTPVGLFEGLLREMGLGLAAGTIVTDVGSTKRSVVRLANEILTREVHFVGSHPMAGGEKRGIEFARADLFAGAQCILTPTKRTDSGALAVVEEFWKALGMRTVRMSPEAHDRLVCDVSHLPHLVAAALVAMQDEEALKLAGRGFLDTTRVAAGDGGLWRDILIDNRENVREAIGRLRVKLDELAGLLEPGQAQRLKQWLDEAADRRERLASEKLREEPGH
jgi:prephenate dehydrogenase